MPNLKTLTEWSDTLTPEQQEAALALIRAETSLGTVAALRKAGVVGSRGHIRALIIQTGFDLDTLEARGWNVEKVEQAAWDVAVNPAHPSWDRANARILKAYNPRFRDQVDHEHRGRMEVANPDVAAAIDRFHEALSSAVVRLTARAGETSAARDALPAGNGASGLPVGRLARPPRPTAAGD